MFDFWLVNNYGVYVLSQVGPLTLCVAPLGPGGQRTDSNALTPLTSLRATSLNSGFPWESPGENLS